MSTPPPNFTDLLERFKVRWSWEQAEWTALSRPLTFEFYENWISEGYHGEMDYLRRHQPLKENPESLLAQAQSILVITKPYVPHYEPHGRLNHLRQAAYARNKDYHDVLGAELKAACAELSREFPGHHFRPGTDSLPVMERDFARRAGLGWVGKNTCLIHPKKGSFFFIGEILSTLKIETTPTPVPDFCGTCTRCIDICPTKAILEPRKLDARRCISYWTIESKQTPPISLAENFGDWFFGCDLCQSVCPWNQKPFRGQSVLNTELILSSPTLDNSESRLFEDLKHCLTASDQELIASVKGSPLERAKAFGLRRNAIIVAANRKLLHLTPAIQKYVADERLGELARWAVAKLAED